jgi:hypothetical protein
MIFQVFNEASQVATMVDMPLEEVVEEELELGEWGMMIE